MIWGNDLDIGVQSVTQEDNINWKKRYEFVRNQIDDKEYILSRIRGKMIGQTFVSVCPFPSHNEKTGSFTVYPRGYSNGGPVQEYTSFYCYGCGCGGDVIKFKQMLEGLSSKKEACKLLEKEHDINIEDNNIRQVMLLEGLESVKNTQIKMLDFVNINRICSGICKEYLNWIRQNFPMKISNEFDIIEKFYKYFDEQILEMNMIEAKDLINETENIIKQRRVIILQS
jgi:hypothetical protein